MTDPQPRFVTLQPKKQTKIFFGGRDDIVLNNQRFNFEERVNILLNKNVRRIRLIVVEFSN